MRFLDLILVTLSAENIDLAKKTAKVKICTIEKVVFKYFCHLVKNYIDRLNHV